MPGDKSSDAIEILDEGNQYDAGSSKYTAIAISDTEEQPSRPSEERKANQKLIKDLRKRIKELEKEAATLKVQKARKKELIEKIKETVVCEVCKDTLSKPFILRDCGHTFCQTDLEKWFEKTLSQNPHYQAEGSNFPLYYTCPKCRKVIRGRPVQNFLAKDIIGNFGQVEENDEPNAVQIWKRFFPVHLM